MRNVWVKGDKMEKKEGKMGKGRKREREREISQVRTTPQLRIVIVHLNDNKLARSRASNGVTNARGIQEIL